MLAPDELLDFSRSYQGFTQAEIAEFFPNVDIGEVIRGSGIRIREGEQLLIPDPGAAKQAGAWFADEHLDLLKTLAEVSMIRANADLLSEGFLEVSDTFNRVALGQEVPPTTKQRAVNMTLGLLGDYVGQIYVEEFASESTKLDVETMIVEMIDVYRERIQNLDWMSDATKEQAINKMDAITFKVGWPDTWEDPLADRQLLSYADGGSLFQNVTAIRLAGWERVIEEQDDPVDRERWFTPPYMVNAFYNPQNNEIVIPYGILQPPFYDETASRSANLGAIGMVIGHELSHAFDTTGAQFDESGNLSNWWTEEDFAAFIELCEAITVFFDGIEIAPGILSNGTLTLTENISDNGGLAVALEVAMKDPAFSAEDFFKTYAVMWRALAPREILLINSQAGVHSANRIRVNQALQNFELFHETFNIQPGDGMYVPASERISLW
jgi:putative endopeptidase